MEIALQCFVYFSFGKLGCVNRVSHFFCAWMGDGCRCAKAETESSEWNETWIPDLLIYQGLIVDKAMAVQRSQMATGPTGY